MGNAQFTLNEANAQLPIDKSFLQKYQKHVTTVDHALTGLARGIDALQSTCRLFLQQYCKSTDGQVKDTSASQSERAVILIIQKIHECISDNKTVTIESVKNFFSFIKETGDAYMENTEEAFSSLSVNTYQSLLNEYTLQDDWFIDFYRKRNELLKKEINMLQKDKKIQQELIETLQKQQSLDKEELKNQIKDWIEQNSLKDKRSEGSSCETKCAVDPLQPTAEQLKTIDTKTKISTEESAERSNIIPHENIALSKESIDYQSMHESTIADLRKKIEILEEDKSKMQKELQETKKITLTQLTAKKVTVQVYSRYTYYSTGCAEEDLLVQLKTEFSKRGLELRVMQCKRQGHVVNGCPLLVTIDHSFNARRKNEIIETAMSGLEYTKDKAVLVFHLTDGNGLLNELKLYSKEYKSLGGVIHFGYKSSLYTSSLNTKSITEVIAFIEKCGEIQHDVVETYF